MLRSLFVLVFIVVGSYFAVQKAFYSLLFYIANAYFRPEEWVWSGWVRSLHLSLVLGVYTICSFFFSQQKFVWNRRISVLWLFLLQALLSTLFTEHSDYCFENWIEFLKVIAITYMIVCLVTDFARLRLMIHVMVLSLGLEQAKQGMVYLLIYPGGLNSNPVPFLGDNNGVAIGMLMLVPLIGLLLNIEKNNWIKLFYSILFFGCFYRALSTYSRGGFLTSISMMFLWWLRSERKAVVLIILLIVAAIVLPTLPGKFWDRMYTIYTFEQNQETSAMSRLHFWQVAIDMAEANPFSGVGFSGYIKAYNHYDFSDGLYGENRSVHSSFFGVLAELSYPGIILYIYILFSALNNCIIVRKRTAYGPVELYRSSLALEMSLVAFMVGGSFVPLQYNEMLWHLVGLTIVLERISGQQEVFN